MKDDERFWKYVLCGEACWIWKGAKSGSGYGRFWMLGRMHQAHRASWEIENGPIPYGQEVCHTCNNKLCVRPSHLYLGTHQRNMEDAAKAGLMNNRLTPMKAAAVYLCVKSGIRSGRVAELFCIDRTMVQQIAKGSIWRHATKPCAAILAALERRDGEEGE